MAQNGEIKEEITELKSRENLPNNLCNPPPPTQRIPSRSPRAATPSDPDSACSQRSSEGGDDSAADRRPLKRPRDGDEQEVGERRKPTRCSGSGCRKRVGLMGFTCRCGDVFCSEHRYSDRHDCTFDYKAAGREAIRRENPVVRAAKLVKV